MNTALCFPSPLRQVYPLPSDASQATDMDVDTAAEEEENDEQTSVMNERQQMMKEWNSLLNGSSVTLTGIPERCIMPGCTNDATSDSLFGQDVLCQKCRSGYEDDDDEYGDVYQGSLF